MSVSGSEYTTEEEDFRDDMRVFLRLRPINKLEQSRRSKNCIELHEDPTLVTVDSPLEGEYDYTFDHVFEEYATQEEVFEHAVADIPIAIMEGFNCTCIAYGQTGTGKTHTMLGADSGSHSLLQKSSRNLSSQELERGAVLESTPDDLTKEEAEKGAVKIDMSGIKELNTESEGMIPRTVSSLFALMAKVKPTTEFTVRVSYVEIYLEKILDLLHPQGTVDSITIEEDEEEADRAAGTKTSVRIKGASELCCLDEADVCALLARGNACRTMSSTEMNTESSRSHAIFVLRLEQHDRLTDKVKKSVLHMIDLAGSELASKEANKRSSMAASMSAVKTEALMINKSLSALNKLIRAQLAHQGGEQDIPLDDIARQSNLSRLLRPCFGGNCLTTLILTASPSSYNIGETISTINFGQRCRRIFNDPIQNIEDETPQYYRKQVKDVKSQFEDAMALVRALAGECLRMKDGESSGSGPIWDTIAYLGKKHDSPINFKVSIVKQSSTVEEGEEDQENEINFYANKQVQLQDDIEILKEENEYLSRQRLDTEGHLAELQSEIAVLRTQNENLSADKKRNLEELVNAKNEVQALSQRKLEVEHNLRTSQFRENEAIVFLRQFRRFYRNVLKDKAAHGAGSINAITSEVTDKVPNAPNLGELRDIDRLLVDSGLLEEYEIDSDKASGSYLPSKEALLRSAGAAQRAAAVEAELMRGDVDVDDDDDAPYVSSTITRISGPLRLPGPSVQMNAIPDLKDAAAADNVDDVEEDATPGAGADAGAGTQPTDDRSILSSDTVSLAHSIARVQATGALVTRKQRLLKTPAGMLTAMREKDLEKELLEMSERCIDLQMALNEEKAVVDALTNKAGGLSKKRLAQEAISLRQQVEKKTASLTAIAWKMNELNLINKTYNEKMANREQHVLYLEEQLVELQNNNRRLIVDSGESEKKLRDEIDNLHNVVAGMAVPLWQFGEKNVRDKPFSSRIILTSVGGNHDAKQDLQQPRKSLGETEPDLQLPDFPDVGAHLPLGRKREDDSSIDDDRSLDGSGELELDPEPPKRPKRRTSDRLRMTVMKLRVLNSFKNASGSQGEPESPIASSNRSTKIGSSFVVVEKIDAETQTNLEAEVVKADKDMQTDEVQIFDIDVPLVIDRGTPESLDEAIQTEDVQIYDINVPMVLDSKPLMLDVECQTEELEGYDVGVQTDDEPLIELYEKLTQTDDVEFVVYVGKDDACVQTEPLSVTSVQVQTDEWKTERLASLVDGTSNSMAETRSTSMAPMGNPERSSDDIWEVSQPRSKQRNNFGGANKEVSRIADDEAVRDEHVKFEDFDYLGDGLNREEVSHGNELDDYVDPHLMNDDHLDNESEGHDIFNTAVSDRVDLARALNETIALDDWNEENWNEEDSLNEEFDGPAEIQNDEDDQFSSEEKPSQYFDSQMTKLVEAHEAHRDAADERNGRSDVPLNEEEDIDHVTENRAPDALADFEDEADGGEFSDEESNSSEEQNFHVVRHVKLESGRNACAPADDFVDYIDDLHNDSRKEDEVKILSQHSIINEEHNDNDSLGNHSNGSSYEGRDMDVHEANATGEGTDLLREEAITDDDKELPHRDKTGQHNNDIVDNREDFSNDSSSEWNKELSPSGAPVGHSDTAVVSTPDRSRNVAPLDRYGLQNVDRSKSPTSRFMPESSHRVASTRFMPTADANKTTTRSSRRFKLDDDRLTPNSSSRRNPSIPILPSSTSSSNGMDEGAGYDELGQRWGLTDDEIAADAAVLNTPRQDGLLNLCIDDELDVIEEASHDEEGAPGSPNSLDGEERDLFDYDFNERRSSHGPVRRVSYNEKPTEVAREVEANDVESDKDQNDEVPPSVPNDDFEKMMDETAAALAAADALIGIDDEDDDDGGTYANDDDYGKEENDYEAEMSDDSDDYISDERESDEESEDEFRSAQDYRFTRKGERYENEKEQFPARHDPSIVVTADDRDEGREVDDNQINPVVANQGDTTYQINGEEEFMSSPSNENAAKSPNARHPSRPEVAPTLVSSLNASPLTNDQSGRGRRDEKKKRSKRSSKSPHKSPRHEEEHSHPRSQRHSHEDGEREGRRNRPKSSRPVAETEKDMERRQRSSRRITDDEGGRSHRQASNRRLTTENGDFGAERRRHRSSRHLGDSGDVGGSRHRRRSSRHLHDSGEFGESRRHHKSSSRGGSGDVRESRRRRSGSNLGESDGVGESRHHHRSRRRVGGDEGEEDAERRRTSRRRVDGDDAEDVSERRRTSRRVDRDEGEDGGDRHRRSSRRASGDVGAEGGERRHRSSRRASGDVVEEGEGSGRRHKSSRHVSSEEKVAGDVRPHRSRRTISGKGDDVVGSPNAGADIGDERKVGSSRRRRSTGDDANVQNEQERRADEERRRKKRSSGEQRSSRRSSSRLGD